MPENNEPAVIVEEPTIPVVENEVFTLNVGDPLPEKDEQTLSFEATIAEQQAKIDAFTSAPAPTAQVAPAPIDYTAIAQIGRASCRERV